MKQKNHLHSNRSTRDLSRPAVFLNNSQRKNRLENKNTTKEKVPQK